MIKIKLILSVLVIISAVNSIADTKDGGTTVCCSLLSLTGGTLSEPTAGQVINKLNGIQTKGKISLTSAVGTASAETTGQYAYFNSWTCPAGWVEANGANGTVDLRGTFIRSLDKGRGMDSDAPWRAAGSYQGDQLRSHNHSIAGMADSGGHGSWIESTNKSSQITTQWTGSAGGSETRPKNIALLACMKL